MKVLFFHAAAGHPKVALPLMSQAGDVLRPFHRFLGQAIHTAKRRQTRYQLTWERVRNLRTFRLEAVDSLLRVPRRPPGVVLADWPSGKAHDFRQMGFVKNRGVMVRFESATQTADGLLVGTDVPLQVSDRLIWCEVESSVKHEAAALPPARVTSTEGRAMKLVGPVRPDVDGRHWLLLVEGRVGDCELLVDGEVVEAEVLPGMDGLQHVVDKNGAAFDVSGGTLRSEVAPTDGLLRGGNGARYNFCEVGRPGRSGCWVQLLAPESVGAEESVDPRAAFCEGDIEAVWTQKKYRDETTYKVWRVDQDRYQILLDRYPPDGSTLYLPVDRRNLFLQKRALEQLANAPLPHHQGLLRLCEDPERVRWPVVQPEQLPEGGWRSLTDSTRSGTDEQRSFVRKALGSPDFAFLEGPPGSGKTTAICEVIQQLVERGQRVLLCASTHVAIDNVLERLLESSSPIDAIRIGKHRSDDVDDAVRASQLDERVNSLVTQWQQQPAMAGFGDVELRRMAERTVIMAANLTCGTTMGIVNHPLFRGRDEDMQIWARPITTMPHWDVLIVDEASKTLIQEFMVPALTAKRWIVVGDVRQLPPFAERADLVANLRDLVDESGKPVFPPDHQRACLLLFRLLRRSVRQQGMRWLLVERPGVLEWIARELAAKPEPDLSVVRVVPKLSSANGLVEVVTVAQLQAGEPEALRTLAADWVLVANDLIGEVADLLPANLLHAEDLAGAGRQLGRSNRLFKRQAWWFRRAGTLRVPYRDRDFKYKHKRDLVATQAEAMDCEKDWLDDPDHDFANQLAWRLTRLHELKHSRDKQESKRLREELDHLLPGGVSIKEPISEIEDIGLPSILEVLQEGIGDGRSKRRSALTVGLKTSRSGDFGARFESLSFQHRMHAEIASFPREVIYKGDALRDANTIQSRDAKLGWSFGRFRARRVWAHVDGREQGGVNSDEIHAMRGALRDFISWAKRSGPPDRTLSRVWEVACLCFYVKQERAISEMLRELSGDDRKTRFLVRGDAKEELVEIVCGTVDRFQGREADLVLISMRNTAREGFLDSPNRLNVGVTRARQQLVVFGNANFFGDCRISELRELARRSPLVEDQEVRKWRLSR